MSQDNETDIIIKAYVNLCAYTDQIKKHHNTIIEINESIKILNNNYFETICNYSLFEDYLNTGKDTNSYDELINNLNDLQLYIKNKILDTCQHVWVDDYIDIDPETSQPICYCNLCGITKK
jgi:hypothetical protein